MVADEGMPNVVGCHIGYKYVGGLRTYALSVVVCVVRKLSPDQLPPGHLVPKSLQGARTDVIEVGELEAQALTGYRRPCPAGYSVGHVDITAGTLGVWVQRGNDPTPLILSNNHVLAASNEANIGDFILQPGAHDGGTSPNDHFARLDDYVHINFPFEEIKKNKQTAAAAWKAWRGPANLVARMVGCPYRMQVKPLFVEQPDPNLVDAAIAHVLFPESVDNRIAILNAPPAGICDLELDDIVIKVGRTTEWTRGRVIGVSNTSNVNYGDTKGIARFADQILIARLNVNDPPFSQPGDSGSAILRESDMCVGGLLFGGSDVSTVANRISNVVALLGVRLLET
jgi:hypothetical protein